MKGRSAAQISTGQERPHLHTRTRVRAGVCGGGGRLPQADPISSDPMSDAPRRAAARRLPGADGSAAREHILDENDALWMELRHCHVADVYATLSKRIADFQSKNKAAKCAHPRSCCF